MFDGYLHVANRLDGAWGVPADRRERSLRRTFDEVRAALSDRTGVDEDDSWISIDTTEVD